MTQLLPGTAREMAASLGVPYREDLLRGTSPAAADYQRALGRAYFQQGWNATGGDPRQALMYYHGGPNRRLWGPRTHAYADEVLRRVGS
jgi:soluble lytic murein transglycosylase-like protein